MGRIEATHRGQMRRGPERAAYPRGWEGLREVATNGTARECCACFDSRVKMARSR